MTGTTRNSGKPKVVFTNASDGTRIAYSWTGEGSPLVFIPPASNDVERDWNGPRGATFREFAKRHRVVRYDGRGQGLSDRRPEGLSLDCLVDDLSAVVDHLGLHQFALVATAIGGVTAIAYAAKHPERVTSLILWRAFPNFLDYFHSSLVDVLPIALTNWDVFALAVAHVRVGWANSERALKEAARFRESVERDFYLREVDIAPQLDASRYLTQIQTPTLVLCRRFYHKFDLQISRQLARQIPSAKLHVLGGASGDIKDGIDDGVGIIEDFMERKNLAERHGSIAQKADGLTSLTSREKEILSYVAQGKPTKEIAFILGLSTYTVFRHIATIYEKINLHNRAEATRYAIDSGLISARAFQAIDT